MHRIRTVWPVFCAALFASWASAGTIIYVDDNAGVTGDGSRWEVAFRHLQDALAAADSAALPIEIRVAQGIYRPDRSSANPAGDRSRDATFRLRNQVTIKGGFAGTGAALAADEHDPALYPAVLSGDLNGDDGPNFANSLENSYHVVVALNVDATAVLKGVTVEGGRADGPGFGPSPESREQGAAVNVYDASPTLRDCIFQRNWMRNHGTVNDHGFNTTLENCVFRDNFAGSFGAGLYIHFHSETHAMNCRFDNNVTTGDGGGVYNKQGGDSDHGLLALGGHERHEVARLEDCVFEGNRAVRGAGMYNSANSEAHIDRCRFVGNIASDVGGGCYGETESTPQLSMCEFVANEALTGGGLYLKESSASVTDCRFEANRAEFGEGGGGAWLVDCDSSVLRCTFVDNVGFNGAGLYNGGAICPHVEDCDFIGNIALNDNGGGMSNVNCGPTVVNCRFFDNAATTNSENLFVVGGGASSYLCDPVFVGCEFRGNTALRGGGAMFQEGGVGTVIACRFDDNEAFAGGALYSLRTTLNLTSCGFWNNRAAGGFPGSHTGGAVHNSFQTNLNLLNCTFAANAAESGGAVATYTSVTSIEGSILWGDVGGELLVADEAPTTLNNNIVQGGWSGSGTGNRDVDPRWNDPAVGDFQLTADSPGIDAGDAAFVPPEQAELDAAGAARVANCFVDLGAYEFDQPTQRGDVNLDGNLNAADVGPFVSAILAGGNSAVRCRADMNGDGFVTVADIGAFVAVLSR